jgi:acetyltransferase-like isoleucine patch superfamily enzyme
MIPLQKSQRVLIVGWKLLKDVASLVDPMFWALAVRRGGDAARLQRKFRKAGATIALGATVVSPDRLSIGEAASVQTGCLIHCGGLEWSDGSGEVRIGSRSYLGHHSILYGAGGLYLGDDVLIGPDVVITSQGHEFGHPGRLIREQPHRFAPVHIENNVWIGAGAIILPGVVVGEGAVIAAGAVVTRDVPAKCLVAGVPASKIRDRSEPGAS